MRMAILAVIAVVLGFLLLGCASQQVPMAPSSTPGANGNAPAASTPADFTGKNLDGLIALGTPIECTVNAASLKTAADVKIDGSKFRMDYSFAAAPGKNMQMSTIRSDDFSYMYVKDIGNTGSCEWVKFTLDSKCADVSSVKDEAPASFDCKAGTFGQSAFVPTGVVCDLTKPMSSMSSDEVLVAGYFPCRLG